jgi:translin
MMIHDAKAIEERLLSLQERWDEVMHISANTVRHAGRAITAMHAGNLKEAKETLAEIEKNIKKLKKIEKGFEYYSLQAHQEYVEAYSLYSILKTGAIPTQEALKEGEAPYILGLLDVVGELKRESLESLRKHEVTKAEKYYKLMVEIHDSMLPMRFANSIVPDLRKKQDTARIQIENTASDLLTFSKVLR